jgi:hypothetical protein
LIAALEASQGQLALGPEMEGADAFGGQGPGGSIGQGSTAKGPPLGIGGGMGGPGIGMGGKTPPAGGPLNVKKGDTMVRGMKGQGESLNRSVRGGPDRADPNASYYEVYPSARRAAEDALSKEQVPAGYKRQVKEYFDSIAPR